MGKTAIVAFKIVGDATDAVRAMGDAEGATGRLASAMPALTAAAAGVLGGVTAGAVMAFNAASDAEQAAGAVVSVFGAAADEIEAYSDAAAEAVGLSKTQYSELASVLGAQLQNMGIPMDEVASQTNDLVTLGADLAATFGGTTADAVAALSSLMRGERDPIEKYGVSIKQADIAAKMAEMGLAGLEGEALKAAETQATLALLTEQTAGAQGQFARETDSAAGSMQIAQAKWDDAIATLGEVLLPYVVQAAEAFGDLSTWMQENASVVQIVAGVLAVISGVILAIAGAMKIYAAAQAIQTAAQWAQNAAWLANPITWIIIAIIAAIAAVVAIIWLLAANWDTVTAWIASAWQTWIVDPTMAFVSWIVEAWGAMTAWLGDAWDQWVVQPIMFGVALLMAAWDAMGAAVKWVFETFVLNPAQAAARFVKVDIPAAVQVVVDWFQSLGDRAADVFDRIIGWIRDALGWLRDLGSAVIPSWVQDLAGIQLSADLTVDPVLSRPLADLDVMPRVLTLDAAPGLALAAAPQRSWFGGPSTHREAPAGDTYIINVDGALDPVAVAEQIETLLDKYRRKRGAR